MALQFSWNMAMPTTNNPHLQPSLHLPSNTGFLNYAKCFKFPSQNQLKLRSSQRRGLGLRASSSSSSSPTPSSQPDEDIEALSQLQHDIEEAINNLSQPAHEDENEEEYSDIESGCKEGGEIEGQSQSKPSRKEVEEAIQKVLDEDLDVAVDKYNLRQELYAKIDFAWINAFAEHVFSGNPAVVCYLPYETDSKWMQKVAKEFNLTATAFLVRRRAMTSNTKSTGKGTRGLEKSLLEMDESGKSLKAVQRFLAPLSPKNVFHLRWFTSKVEIDLCGHGTLAAAHLLFESGIVEDDTVIFHTKAGVLKARKVRGYDEPPLKEPKQGNQPPRTCMVELFFPITQVTECESAEVKKLADVLGNVEIAWAGISSVGNYLVEVPSSSDVKLLKPRFEKMLKFGGRGGLIVTSAGDPDSEFDFISRYFCPKAGIQEDPVTGSAHCALGPYWAEKLQKHTLEGYQASERGGRYLIKLKDVSSYRAVPYLS